MAAEISCEQLDVVKNKLSCEENALERIQIKMAEATAPKARSLIYKVQKQLRDVNEKAYEPQIISIGPYHRGKENLKLMEEHKLRYLHQVIQHKPEVQVADYIAAVAQMEQAARDCYAEPVNCRCSADFIEMLVLDGCFIIELLRKDEDIRLAADNDPIFQTLWIQNSLKRDMMLLENQIPFFVLCKLFDLIEGPYQRPRLVYLVQHLFLPLCPRSDTVSTNMFCSGRSIEKKKRAQLYSHLSSNDVKHILDLLHSAWSPPSSGEYDDVDLMPEGPRIIKSATELINANVEFRALGDAVTMLDVDFRNGALSIPPITIEDSTECILRNLIAYEQYFPIGRQSPFTDYAVLLDCLVNTLTDVNLLSERGIIENYLGHSEAVANIFNRITDSVSLNRSFRYENTFYLINTHYKKRKNRAIAKLKQDYFSSPWAYISFFAALLLLLLTIAQTVFSAVQLP